MTEIDVEDVALQDMGDLVSGAVPDSVRDIVVVHGAELVPEAVTENELVIELVGLAVADLGSERLSCDSVTEDVSVCECAKVSRETEFDCVLVSVRVGGEMELVREAVRPSGDTDLVNDVECVCEFDGLDVDDSDRLRLGV